MEPVNVTNLIGQEKAQIDKQGVPEYIFTHTHINF